MDEITQSLETLHVELPQIREGWDRFLLPRPLLHWLLRKVEPVELEPDQELLAEFHGVKYPPIVRWWVSGHVVERVEGRMVWLRDKLTKRGYKCEAIGRDGYGVIVLRRCPAE